MLDQIVAKKRQTVKAEKAALPLNTLKCSISAGAFLLSRAMRSKRWSLIAECKLQSPAKGPLCTSHSVVALAEIYEANGATALSVHTDEHFLGKLEDLSAVKAAVSLPVLRKDFIIDPYQIYQARAFGADAVLLIARILTPEELREFLYTAWEIGLDCLVEVHDERDLDMVLATPAELIGINNRNLKNFTTDVRHTLELLPKCDKRRIIISESGVKSGADLEILRQNDIKGILVGEGLVKAKNIAQQTKQFAMA